MMKKIVFAIILALFCFGCASTSDSTTTYKAKDDYGMTFSAFNDESYIWESFHFTTNRVNGVK